ncbi:pro-resilin-like [Homarus americanus]|uniref:Pro-resilin-like 21 n=1 Tax=Homarus americanus TaxID=6706 RepID=A0A8J5K2K6_HOMAM|nr:pro-resilin-like [Homarus americanus]KAG7166338.1 Pro-resilin-like 21 [Homarus americanus]
MIAKLLVVLGVVAAATGDRRPSFSYGAPEFSSEESFESYESSEAQYNFNYAVKHDPSGNDFGHQESRDGDNTKGSYYVHLPDGRLQTVTYYVDGDSGYVAEVSYQGEARYPDSYESFESFESREAPRYAPPRPTYG